jgi:hypothetical protein
MTKKLVNFRVDSTLWENYQNYCKSISITATESIINHINSTLSEGKYCKDSCKDDNDNVKTECKDINRQNEEIESIKIQLFNQQINIDYQINLLTQRIDKLEQNNDSLKQDNLRLNNELKIIINNQDKLLSELGNPENNTVINKNDYQVDNSTSTTVITTEKILSQEDSQKKDYSSLTVAQLKNKLDQLGIKYRKKATKLELINLLS